MASAGGDLNLFFTVIAASVTAFLGAVVFYHERQSASNKIFIVHSLVGVAWSVATYGSIVAGPESALPWIRAVIFLAVPHVFLFLLFAWNFPQETLKIPRALFWAVFALMAGMMALTTTPFVFRNIKIVAGGIVPVPGVLITLFGPTLVFTVLITFAMVIREIRKATGVLRAQWEAIGSGLLLAYALLIFGVFVPVIGFENTIFVRFSPLFILPIFIGAAYAILRHQLFNVKVIASEALVFFLLVASIAQLIAASDPLAQGLSVFVTIAVLGFGVLLVRSVLKEVEQREQLQELTKKLEAANEKLEELSHFKTQLLSIASHQFRSPLAAIKGFISLLLDGSYGPVGDKVKETLSKMRMSADGLLDLINTLLDMRKVDEGRMDYQFAKSDMKQLVTEVFEALRPLAIQRGLEFTLKTPPENLFVTADVPKLKQVVQNLIDNSIKYTSAGFVRVELYPANDAAMLSVTDSGAGFAPELGAQLFQEFVRDERVKKQILGTGLGLYIARRIIEAHGGRVWAESKGLEKGATFFVTLKKV